MEVGPCIETVVGTGIDIAIGIARGRATKRVDEWYRESEVERDVERDTERHLRPASATLVMNPCLRRFRPPSPAAPDLGAQPHGTRATVPLHSKQLHR